MSDQPTQSDAASIIDAGIRQYLHSPQVVQAIRATLRHAIAAQATDMIEQAVEAAVSRQLSELKITRTTQ